MYLYIYIHIYVSSDRYCLFTYDYYCKVQIGTGGPLVYGFGMDQQLVQTSPGYGWC